MGDEGGTVMLIYKKNWLQKKTNYDKDKQKKRKKTPHAWGWVGAPSCPLCHPLLQWHPMATLWAVACSSSAGCSSLLLCSPSCHCHCHCSPLAAVSLVFVSSPLHCHFLAAVHFHPPPTLLSSPFPLVCHPQSLPCEQGLAVVVVVVSMVVVSPLCSKYLKRLGDKRNKKKKNT